MSTVLLQMGAKVFGFSDCIPTKPSLFEVLNLDVKVQTHFGDIAMTNFISIIDEIKPDFIVHMAAQPIVINSIENPRKNWNTNLFGTLNLLEGLRETEHPVSVLIVTSDKCYENVSQLWGYRECDRLGGEDPYSASKAAVEIMVNSYFKTFFGDGRVNIATARAGNVIGGGDWSDKRLLPDIFRAWDTGEELLIRHPHSTRPWQHVLEPVFGYLEILSNMDITNGESYNIAPGGNLRNIPVIDLVTELSSYWPGLAWNIGLPKESIEHNLLQLSSEKIFHHLNWSAKLDYSQTVSMTANWYKAFRNGEKIDDLHCKQIDAYMSV